MGHRHRYTSGRTCLTWSLPVITISAEGHQRCGTVSGMQKPLEKWPPPVNPSEASFPATWMGTIIALEGQEVQELHQAWNSQKGCPSLHRTSAGPGLSSASASCPCQLPLRCGSVLP